MPSRDIWKSGSARYWHDLLSSALLSLLFPTRSARAVFFVSPWTSDFDLFDNRTRAVAALFPNHEDQPQIKFSDYLVQLQTSRDVRVITSPNPTSDAFLDSLKSKLSSVSTTRHLTVRMSPQTMHEKGILAPGFYIEGSMNVTHSGVHINGEKISYHAGSDQATAGRIAAAYLEFERRWSGLTGEDAW